jgi:hypothetical protein
MSNLLNPFRVDATGVIPQGRAAWALSGNAFGVGDPALKGRGIIRAPLAAAPQNPRMFQASAYGAARRNRLRGLKARSMTS